MDSRESAATDDAEAEENLETRDWMDSFDEEMARRGPERVKRLLADLLPLSLSFDHRLIDGADGARALRWMAEALEKPLLLALEG